MDRSLIYHRANKERKITKTASLESPVNLMFSMSLGGGQTTWRGPMQTVEEHAIKPNNFCLPGDRANHHTSQLMLNFVK